MSEIVEPNRSSIRTGASTIFVYPSRCASTNNSRSRANRLSRSNGSTSAITRRSTSLMPTCVSRTFNRNNRWIRCWYPHEYSRRSGG